MRSNYKRLGDYIRQVDIRNKKNKSLSVDEIRGISSITKSFVKTKANLIDVSSDNYKVVGNQQFAFNPNTARMGDKIPIGLNTGNEILVSSIYYVFEVDAFSILPKYLLLWFRRPEFDRYARYHSHGSAREIFDWDAMCDVMLPVPPLAEQQKIVHAYNVIENRITLKRKINDNLEAQARALYADFVATNPCEYRKLRDYVTTQYGYTTSAASEPVGTHLLRITDIAQRFIDWSSVPYGVISDAELPKYLLSVGDIVVARTGATVGYAKMIGKLAPPSIFASYLVRITPIDRRYQYFFGLAITSNEYKQYIQTNAGGSAQPQANPQLMCGYDLLLPPADTLADFNNSIEPILDRIEQNEFEVAKLFDMQNLLTVSLSSNR